MLGSLSALNGVGEDGLTESFSGVFSKEVRASFVQGWRGGRQRPQSSLQSYGGALGDFLQKGQRGFANAAVLCVRALLLVPLFDYPFAAAARTSFGAP